MSAVSGQDNFVAPIAEPTKRCPCGVHYGPGGWTTLRLIGIQHGAEGERFEIRACKACGTSLTIELTREAGHAQAS